MASIESAIAKAKAYANDNAHGYELGYHTAAQMRTGTDCSGLVRYYAAAVEGVSSVDNYPDFSTRTEKAKLTARGWTSRAFSLASAKRGDVLLSNSKGHTVIYLGNSRILGAEGNWDGRHGDSSGSEVCERSYYAYGYETILRPPASKTKTTKTTTTQEDEVTDADVKKVVKAIAASDEVKKMVRAAVWEYNWGTTADTDAAKADKKRGNVYNRLAAIFDQTKTTGATAWGYKNAEVNGDKDVYAMLTEVHDKVCEK